MFHIFTCVEITKPGPSVTIKRRVSFRPGLGRLANLASKLSPGLALAWAMVTFLHEYKNKQSFLDLKHILNYYLLKILFNTFFLILQLFMWKNREFFNLNKIYSIKSTQQLIKGEVQFYGF